MQNQLTHTARPFWRKPVTQCLASFLILLLLPVASYSQNSYQVEFNAGSYRFKEALDKTETVFISSEIFLEEVETGSHPYLEAAFLEQASSIGFLYVDNEATSTFFDIDETDTLILINYVTPESSHIFQIGYGASDSNIKNGFNGTANIDNFIFSIGTYLTNNSAMRINYLQRNIKSNISGFPIFTAKATDIDIEYKLVKELRDGKAFNIEALITTSEFDDNTTKETNTILELYGDYYLNQSISVGISIEKDAGDDKSNEGITIGLHTDIFLTPSFAIYAEHSQFSADNAFSVDSDSTEIGASVRF